MREVEERSDRSTLRARDGRRVPQNSSTPAARDSPECFQLVSRRFAATSYARLEKFPEKVGGWRGGRALISVRPTISAPDSWRFDHAQQLQIHSGALRHVLWGAPGDATPGFDGAPPTASALRERRQPRWRHPVEQEMRRIARDEAGGDASEEVADGIERRARSTRAGTMLLRKRAGRGSRLA